MRVVVVGATGNLGTALLTRLQAEPSVTELAGVARRAPRSASPPYGDVTWFGIDIGDDAAPSSSPPRSPAPTPSSTSAGRCNPAMIATPCTGPT